MGRYSAVIFLGTLDNLITFLSHLIRICFKYLLKGSIKELNSRRPLRQHFEEGWLRLLRVGFGSDCLPSSTAYLEHYSILERKYFLIQTNCIQDRRNKTTSQTLLFPLVNTLARLAYELGNETHRYYNTAPYRLMTSRSVRHRLMQYISVRATWCRHLRSLESEPRRILGSIKGRQIRE